jgi:hypothetical protein
MLLPSNDRGIHIQTHRFMRGIYEVHRWDGLRCHDIVARMWRLYKTGIGLTTGFIGSHTVTLNYSVYTLHWQFTIVLAESSYCVFTGCPSSNTVGSVHLQLSSEDCYFTVDSRLGNSARTPRLTDWRSARIFTLLYSEDSLSATH